MSHDCELDLPESLAHCGSEQLAATLVDELHHQSHRLPLQDFIDGGSWPDEDSLRLSVDAIERREGLVIATVSCKFNALIPTGCADMQTKGNAFGEFKVVLDPKNNRAYVDGCSY